MGKGSPSPPPPPDPAQTAAAQGAANREAVEASAQFNQYGIQSPYGSMQWVGELGSPDRQQIISLNPADQAALDDQRYVAKGLGTTGRSLVNQIDRNPLSLAGLADVSGVDFGALPTVGASEEGRRAAEDAIYRTQSRYLDPRFDQAQERLETQLANQGITRGSEAYQRAQDDLTREREFAYGQARDQAIIGGNERFRTDYQLSEADYNRALSGQLTARQVSEADRTRGLNERMLLRQQPMNELSALLQGTPVFGQPPTASGGQYAVQPADVMGATGLQYQGQLNNYNQQLASQNAALGGLFQLGGTLGAALICSAALKHVGEPVDTQAVLDGLDRLPLHHWTYRGDTAEHIGPMAEAWQEAIGTGDGRTIPIVDAFGALLCAVQALSARVRELEAQQ